MLECQTRLDAARGNTTLTFAIVRVLSIFHEAALRIIDGKAHLVARLK